MTLEQLYKTQRRHFIYKVYPYLNSYALAEDLVQDAFVKAFTKLGQYDAKKGTIKSWFNSILFSLMWNHKRHLKRQPHQVDITNYLDSEDFSYSEDIDLTSVLEEVKNSIHRRVLVLHLVLGYSLAETASLTKEQQGNVRKIVQRYRSGMNDAMF